MSRAPTAPATELDAPPPVEPATRETIHALRDAVRAHVALRLDDPADAAQAGAMAVPACVLWNQFLRFDPASPDWPDRDRFVVSSTRHRPLLDALMRLAGQTPAPDGPTVEYGVHPAVEMAFGPSGQGVGAAIGMALAERQLAARFGRSIVNHRVWALSCGTELATGVAMEASSLAARMRLDRLTVLFEIAPHEEDEAEDTLARYAATGWMVRKVDADDHDAVQAALSAALRSRKPSILACSVTLRPAPRPPASPGAGPEPDHSTLLWAGAARRGASARRSWLRRLVKHRYRGEFERVATRRLPPFWREDWRRTWHMSAMPAILPASGPDTTLGYGRQGLEILRDLLPEMLCLSSRRGRERTEAMPADQALPDCGTLVHGLAALLNGIAVHGGLVPCGAITFVAIDRMRPALRFAAMMRRQVIYLLTDDGLALSEDGAGWLPVEQLASLRAMPNVLVFRPADRRETMECWELALRRADGPSLIALSPMASGVPAPGLRPYRPRDGSARGGYVMEEARGQRQVTLIATGSEIGIARQAQLLLARDGIGAALVSLPCWELFAGQDAAYRDQVLGDAPRIGIEAASGFGWDRWLGPRGTFIGMETFCEAAPSHELYRRLGITAERVHETAIRLVNETGRDFQSPSGQKADGHRARSAAGGIT
ncbi:transketolase-like TK C-terminal-containing protein [Gluconacetobacter sacchari]|uniref:Transketolase n=2 Tax=Gluconacetobacter sacchari TaxID=92759 RepID=A0A7W4IEJ0_9PROT|nr:transketolase C-terminal domain-containing protein [Gluconacetobacter sacchari]MBB2161394.1 transketolase [Gluconacetobacter sacchari]GBQ19743.1 transketolase [Gluconacetobacter sacchari DSM 12717]